MPSDEDARGTCVLVCHCFDALVRGVAESIDEAADFSAIPEWTSPDKTRLDANDILRN